MRSKHNETDGLIGASDVGRADGRASGELVAHFVCDKLHTRVNAPPDNSITQITPPPSGRSSECLGMESPAFSVQLCEVLKYVLPYLGGIGI